MCNQQAVLLTCTNASATYFETWSTLHPTATAARAYAEKQRIACQSANVANRFSYKVREVVVDNGEIFFFAGKRGKI